MELDDTESYTKGWIHTTVFENYGYLCCTLTADYKIEIEVKKDAAVARKLSIGTRSYSTVV